MIDERSIRELTDRIVREFNPERIILFGSYSYGTPFEGSDIDLLVVLPFEGHGIRKAAEIVDRVKPTIPVDIVVRTPEDIERRLGLNDFFLKEIVGSGKVLYESPHS